jgi:PAS domain S-box-containing protein
MKPFHFNWRARMSEREKKSDQLGGETSGQVNLTALHQRIDELEAALQEQSQSFELLQQEIAKDKSDLDLAKDRLHQEITERKRAEDEAQRRAVQARLIYEVGQRVSSELELDDLFSAIVNAISDAFGYYSVILAPVNEDTESLIIGAIAGGFKDILPKDAFIAIGEGMTGYTAATGETQISGDISQDPHFVRIADEETRSELAVPIKSGTKIIGVLDLQSVEHDAFDKTDIILMESLADQVAIAMENARLYEEAQREISERMRVEGELRKHQEHLEERVEERTADLQSSEERYRTLFDGIPVGLYRTTPAGQFLDVNLALVEMYGYPNRENLLDTNVTNVYVDPEERIRWQSLMKNQGIVRDFEAHIQRFDGTTLWVNDTARAFKDEQGKILYYEGSVEDITERKQAEEKLREYQEHLEELVDERTAELQASEERYRTLFDGVPIGLYRTTPDGRVMEVNLAAAQMLGYADRDMALEKASTADAYVDPYGRARWQTLIEQEGVVRDFEERIRRYDGEIVWLSDTARVVKDEYGQVLYYEGSLEDITERKKVEEELRRQKDYFEALFLNSPVAIVTADLDTKVVSWNPRAEKLFGYGQEEAIGRNTDDLVANDPRVREEAQKYTQEIIEMGRVQATTQRTRKDGSLFDVELLALPLVLAGEQVGFYGMYHDISELKRVERELRQQKDYFEAIFVNSPVALLTCDLQVNVVSWNPMAEKMFGYSEVEAIGNHIDDLVATDPKIRDEAIEYTHQLLTTDRVQATVRRNRKDGSLVDVEVLVLPAIVADEKVGYIAIYYDLSELLQARREAETANQAKSIFLANMSHELRTPLNAILGFTQLMGGDANLTPSQQENLGIINQSGEHLLALINDVLEMSKIEAGKVKLREKIFDLYYLLESMEEMFRVQTENKGLDLSFQIEESVPRYVVSDEGKLRQVLSNLIGNAVKFTQEGSVRLIVSAAINSSEKPELRFDVFDTGPGIAPEDLEAVFDPFVQAANIDDLMATQVPEGSGLGLAISRQFVHLMGGDITVSSDLGVGSHFSFNVIVRSTKADEKQIAQAKREVIGLVPGQPAYRLLVVEDQETNRRLLVKLLERLGFEIQEATNGQEAIDSWQNWDPHLIWMDMRMPVMDGREATRHIKSMPGGGSVVIIALTATAFDEDREQILMDGCDDFVRKPFHKSEIFDKLIKHLNVQFLYEEETAQTTEADQSDTAILSKGVETLTTQSPEWMNELHQATLRADIYRILDLIDQIREQDPDLADVLTDFTERYEYQKILSLIQEAGGQ